MARTEARISVDIWEPESDFTELSADAQWMYFVLLSQPDLAHTGVLALRERRWANCAADVTRADIETRLAELERHRYVVIDEDTEELLVRSLIRRDGVYRQPNVLASARNHLPEITSRKILAALRAELERVAVAEDLGERSAPIVTQMIEAIEARLPTPPGGTRQATSENPSPNPSQKGSRNPSPNPSDSPFPIPLNPSGGTAPSRANGRVINDLERPPPNNDPPGPAEKIITNWLAALPGGRTQPAVVAAIARHVRDALAIGTTEADISQALRLWQARGDLGPAVLPSLIHQVATAIPDAAQPGAVVPIRPQRGSDRPPTTAQRMRQGAELVQMFREREEREAKEITA